MPSMMHSNLPPHTACCHSTMRRAGTRRSSVCSAARHQKGSRDGCSTSSLVSPHIGCHIVSSPSLVVARLPVVVYRLMVVSLSLFFAASATDKGAERNISKGCFEKGVGNGWGCVYTERGLSQHFLYRPAFKCMKMVMAQTFSISF